MNAGDAGGSFNFEREGQTLPDATVVTTDKLFRGL
jgi:hypothetical protein